MRSTLRYSLDLQRCGFDLRQGGNDFCCSSLFKISEETATELDNNDIKTVGQLCMTNAALDLCIMQALQRRAQKLRLLSKNQQTDYGKKCTDRNIISC